MYYWCGLWVPMNEEPGWTGRLITANDVIVRRIKRKVKK
jgi:hypothetical protein